MSTINIKLYDILRTEFKLSEAKAKDFAVIVQETIEEEINNKSGTYKSEVKEDLLKMEMHLKGEIKDSKVDTKKWVVGVFFALALMIIGLYLKK